MIANYGSEKSVTLETKKGNDEAEVRIPTPRRMVAIYKISDAKSTRRS